jgi:transposase-like protein
MRKYQILRRRDSGRVKEVGRRSVPLMVPVSELVTAAREGMRDLSDRMGLELMRLAVEEERVAVTENPERLGRKHGQQPGFVFLDGRKVPFPNMRVRSLDGEQEVKLQSYAKFQEDSTSGRLALRDMMRGVSTRDYAEGAEGFLHGYGTARSSVSRAFIRASEAKLKELMERDLSKLDLVAMFMDGVGFQGHLQVVAMGVDAQGCKHVLGLWQGATENHVVCQALLDDLVRRGLNPEKRYLFVIDGGKGLRAAIQKTFGKRGEVQRCQQHKQRNVAGHLPKHLQSEFRRKIAAAYGMTDYAEAKRALESCVRDLERINPSAAASLREGMEETLTLHRLEVPALLRVSLGTTNPMESPFATVRGKTWRVRRWRGADQVQRWAAAALLRAETGWRRLRGAKQMGILIDALHRRENGQETNS